MIHKTAIIDNNAKVSSTANIGPYSVIGPNVEIGEDVIIHSHVNVSGNTIIGNCNKNLSILRLLVMIHKIWNTMEKKTKLIIGNNNKN